MKPVANYQTVSMNFFWCNSGFWTLTFLSTNYCLTRFTCILFLLHEYMFFYQPFYVPRVFLLSASQQLALSRWFLLSWSHWDLFFLIWFFVGKACCGYFSSIIVWFGCLLWHIKLYWLFNDKSSLYIYIYPVSIQRLGVWNIRI